MRFGKYLGKTFLVFAASGAGTAFGAASMTLAAIFVGQKYVFKADQTRVNVGVDSLDDKPEETK